MQGILETGIFRHQNSVLAALPVGYTVLSVSVGPAKDFSVLPTASKRISLRVLLWFLSFSQTL